MLLKLCRTGLGFLIVCTGALLGFFLGLLRMLIVCLDQSLDLMKRNHKLGMVLGHVVLKAIEDILNVLQLIASVGMFRFVVHLLFFELCHVFI